MLYKYDQKSLNKEIEELNKTGYTKIIKTDQKKGCLDILFYSTESKYEIYFYMDISPSNNNFQKKNNKIVKPGLFELNKLNSLISNFCESYIPEQHKELKDFFLFLKDYLESNLKGNNDIDSKNNSKELIFIYNKLENSTNLQLFFLSLSIHFIAILIKILVGQFGYSGEGDSPKFGDFEAQRHWMEITINIPVQDWYTNSKNNRGDYWPLDYPPMSGYHSYLLGKILEKFIPSSVELKKSKGYESPIFKIVMRFFALISDVLVFHVGVNLIFFYIFIYSKKSKNKKPSYALYYIALLLTLINPLMIIIDHGHFQYNNVMHGFFVLALYFLYTENYIFAIIFYSFCVNFKQMGLYYALPFPLYVIKKMFLSKPKNNEKTNNIIVSIIYIGIYGIITLITNVIIYLPWLKAKKINDVFSRIFPVRRGIFEDKVATFWCTINIVFKLNQHFKTEHLIKLALILTIIGCLIPIYAIFTCEKLTKKICTQCFFIVSFAFYLFSFHVHEKTIIVPFLAYLLNLPNMKNVLPSFTLVGMFSLFPLLKRENQIIPYYLTSILFYIICKLFLKIMNIKNNKKEKNNDENDDIIYWLFEICIFSIMLFYHFVDYTIPPPQSYPWFYPMLNAAFCFCYFISIFLYSNYDLLKMVTKKEEAYEKVKIN